MNKIKLFTLAFFSPLVLLGLFSSSVALAEKSMTDRTTSPMEQNMQILQSQNGSMNRGTASMDGADGMGMMRKKRYRYRKRTHRVQVLIPTNWVWHQDNERNKSLHIDLLYGYNAGYFEVGPNVQIYNRASRGTALASTIRFAVGAWGEFNFVRNTRKAKVVPAFGLRVNYIWEERRNNIRIAPYLSLKYFVASRTGLVFNVILDMYGQLPRFTPLQWGVGYAIHYVHYFN